MSSVYSLLVTSISDTQLASPSRCSYDASNLVQSEFWMLTFDLMTSSDISLTSSQLFALVSDMEVLMHTVDSWQFIAHKVVSVIRWQVS